MQTSKSAGLGRQLRCICGCQNVLLAEAGSTSSKNEPFVAQGFGSNVHSFAASLLKQVFVLTLLLDVSIVSLTFGVFHFSLFFIGFISISSFVVGLFLC